MTNYLDQNKYIDSVYLKPGQDLLYYIGSGHFTKHPVYPGQRWELNERRLALTTWERDRVYAGRKVVLLSNHPLSPACVSMILNSDPNPIQLLQGKCITQEELKAKVSNFKLRVLYFKDPANIEIMKILDHNKYELIDGKIDPEHYQVINKFWDAVGKEAGLFHFWLSWMLAPVLSSHAENELLQVQDQLNDNESLLHHRLDNSVQDMPAKKTFLDYFKLTVAFRISSQINDIRRDIFKEKHSTTSAIVPEETEAEVVEKRIFELHKQLDSFDLNRVKEEEQCMDLPEKFNLQLIQQLETMVEEILARRKTSKT